MNSPRDDRDLPAPEMSRPPRWVLPPTIFAAGAAAMALVDWLLPGVTLLTPPWTQIAFIPVAGGSGLAIWAFLHFRRAQTPVEPFQVARQLVTTGPYAWTRNPMYSGLFLLLTGWWIWLGSLSPAIILPLFPLLITRLFIVPEETMLRQRFGAEFDAYAAKVRRWG